jgi:putative membrane protein
MGDWHMGGWPMMGGGIWCAVFWVIVLAVIAVAVYLIVRAAKAGGAGGGKTALDILKERYARGEITREEFEAMKKDLSS